MVKRYQCSDLRLEAEIVLGYETLWYHFKEDCTLGTYCHEILKSLRIYDGNYTYF